MTPAAPVSFILPQHGDIARAEMTVRVVKRLNESLMWYQNSMNATLITSDLDNGWALIQLGSCALALLSVRWTSEDIPISTAVCVPVETIHGLVAWAEDRELCAGALEPGPWGREAVWLTDPEGNAIIYFSASASMPLSAMVTGSVGFLIFFGSC
jgi:hypothetical protein